MDDTEPSSWTLSTEFLPQPEGAIQTVCALGDDTIVSGGDDKMVTIWQRIQGGKEFTSVHMCHEHTKGVRALVAIFPCRSLPQSGFATGCLDGKIRIFHSNGTLLRTLEGHPGGVISLAMSAEGDIISGGWDGTARVWDVHEGTCLRTLGGQENGICVLGLPNGDVVTGSTGRKDQRDRHVDFKIRIWRGESVVQTITNHEQAVRDLAAVRGVGFASASNDGTIRLWSEDGRELRQWTNPVSERNEVPFAYRVSADLDGLIYSGHEDLTLRVYDPERGLQQTLQLPGVPWGFERLPNGDFVVGCAQAGTSRRGHVYIFSTDARKAADDSLKELFQEACKPPKRSEGSAAGTSSSAGDDAANVQITGDYEDKAAHVGTRDGEYGFFRMSDGAIMVCAWESESQSWMDIGPMVDGPGDGAAPVGQTGQWDVERPVTVEMDEGTKTMQLQFNLDEDPMTVTQRFMDQNGIGVGYYEQIRDFVLEQRRNAGGGDVAVAGGGKPARISRHFPPVGYSSYMPLAWDKLLPRFRETNATLRGDPATASVALTEEDWPTMDALITVLQDEARYHASKVTEAQLQLVVRKLLQWPAAHSLTALNIVRKMMLHTNAAEAGLAPNGPEWINRVSANARASDAPRGVVIVALRLWRNAFNNAATREVVLTHSSVVLETVTDVLSRPGGAPVSQEAALLLINFAVFCHANRGSLSAEMQSLCERMVTVIDEGFPTAEKPEAQFAWVVLAGSLATLDARFKDRLKASRLPALLGSIAPGENASLGEARDDLQRALQS